ncbi:MAG: bifunctional DNA-formamidopyrimidine glycosylase/DNA-(apurinic or apyrimidinic site) lyase [Candidatus Dasytiphilus stammeri]
MPELPEIENIKNGIINLIGKTILYSIIRNGVLRVPVSKELYLLSDQEILNIQRRAKYIIVKITKGYIIIHLGMSGRLSILPIGSIPYKHDHIDLIINNGKILRYTDTRRFGLWIWCNTKQKCKLLQSLGPEPLSKSFSINYLINSCSNKKRAVKSCLMDNKIVAGIGNIYANESLFLAGIFPIRNISTLSRSEIKKLIESIKIILQQSIRYGGTSFRDYFLINGTRGQFIHKLNVYGKNGKLCHRCGAIIQRLIYHKRGTFFCPQCQF